MFASNNSSYWKCIEPCGVLPQDLQGLDEKCHDCCLKGSHFINAYTFRSTKRTVFLCGHCAKIANAGEQYITNRDKLIVENAEAALIDLDTWAVSSYHGPGSTNVPGLWLPNRIVIIRLYEKLTNIPFLVALNQIRPDKDGLGPFACLKQLEHRTGSKLRYIISIDSGHNLYISSYANEFPDALVYYPPGRIQREQPNLSKIKNTRIMDYEDPLPELQEIGLSFHIVRGVRERAIDLNGRPKFGTVEGVLIYFEKTKTLYQGSHSIWVLAPKEYKESIGKLFQMLIGKPGSVVTTTGKKSALITSIWDLDLFKKSVTRICGTAKGWEWEYYTDFHMCPNYILRADQDKSRIEKEFEYLNNVESLEIKPLEIPEGFVADTFEGYNHIPLDWRMPSNQAPGDASKKDQASQAVEYISASVKNT